jgi:uncharacterized protein YceK
MGHISATLVAVLLLCACGGCGTMLNLSDMERLDVASRPVDVKSPYERPAYPFGGVGNDIAWLKSADPWQPIDVLFPIVDMPLSLAGDVATLPWALHRAMGSTPKEARPNDEWRRFWMDEKSAPAGENGAARRSYDNLRTDK